MIILFDDTEELFSFVYTSKVAWDNYVREVIDVESDTTEPDLGQITLIKWEEKN